MKLQIDNLGKVAITVDKNYWDINKDYDRLVIVERQGTHTCFLSRKPVPAGTSITNREYWIQFSTWQDIPYEIVQEFGESTEVVISQKVVTLKINELQELIDDINEVIGEGGSIDERIVTAKSEVKSDIVDDASEEGNTLKKLEDRLSDVEESIGEGGSVDERISVETNRAQEAEELLREAYESLSQSQPIPKTAEEWAAMTSWEEGVIYRVAGTTSYTDYMYNGITTISMATYDNAIDDEPIADSNNLVKSGGVFNDKLYLNDYRKKGDAFGTGIVNSLGNWEYVGTSKSIVLRVKQGDVLKIKANATRDSIVAILASYLPKNNSNADFASGESGRRQITASTESTITITASDAAFVLIVVQRDDRNYMPDNIYLNGYDLNLSVQEHILSLYETDDELHDELHDELREVINDTENFAKDKYLGLFEQVGYCKFEKPVNIGQEYEQIITSYQFTDYINIKLSSQESNLFGPSNLDKVLSYFILSDGTEIPTTGYIVGSESQNLILLNNDYTINIPTNYIVQGIRLLRNSHAVIGNGVVYFEISNPSKSKFYSKEDKTVYVATDGNDSNTGEFNLPLATINAALKRGNDIILRGGVYKNQFIDLSFCPNANINIKAYIGEKVSILNNIVATSATKVSGYTKVYSCPIMVDVSSRNWLFQFGVNDTSTLIDNSDRTYIHSRRTYRCDCTRLVRVSSIAAIENWNGYSWYEENGTLYFSSPELLSNDTPLFTGGGNLLSGTSNKDIHVNGIRSYGKTINAQQLFNGEFCNCAAIGCSNGSGWKLDLSQNMVLKMCEAAFCDKDVSSTTGDGFNIHSSTAIIIGTTDMESVFSTFTLIDCWSHDNFNDGYGDHEGCNGHIQNGVYEFNSCGADGTGGNSNGVGYAGHGGGITPAQGAHDIICGSISQRNYDDGVRYASNNDMTPQGCKIGTFTAIGVISRNNAHYGFNVNKDNQIVDIMNCIASGNGTDNYHSENGAIMRMSIANSQNT